MPAALPELRDDNERLELWRGVLRAKDFPDRLAAEIARNTSVWKAAAPGIGVRAAREAGKSGAKLLAALTPLAGLTDTQAKMPQDFKVLAAAAKQNGDPARGELIYRRAALTCTVCHAIGGAGGKVGPDMTSLGASAPLDYIIESVLTPAAKVKEGYNAVTLTLKDGTQAAGVQARETPEEVFLRDATGKEQRVPKAQIASSANLGSLMPAGLTDQLQDRERLDLFAFLGELGKPGPYDASKGNVARAWRLFSGNDAEKVVKGEAALDTALPGYTLVDGRFVKELLEAAAPIAANGAPTMLALTQFQSTGGKTRLTLTGAEKVWLDGQPLAIGGELAPELGAGVHTLIVKLDVNGLPPFLRAESPDARFLGN
jgi:putative heme-binding domain-containing protein